MSTRNNSSGSRRGGHVAIRRDSYYDSVFLMRISREIKAIPGIEDAVVAMGTAANKRLLTDTGYPAAEVDPAGPNDLILAIRGEGAEPAQIEKAIDVLLKGSGTRTANGGENGARSGGAAPRPRDLAGAVRIAPDANVALISVPGIYAAREARLALERGLHVMLFSDNVALEDEIALKNLAARRGLLMMGPDCGTAILNGKPLAFANVVRRGAIGVVGASGTGIQEITCAVHRLGGGISQAIGTGGRDLSENVGGLMTRMGIEALAADPQTQVIVVVSKPPAPAVAEKVLEALRAAGKPAVVHFVGSSRENNDASSIIRFASSLAGAAEEACRLAGIAVADSVSSVFSPDLTREIARRLAKGAVLRGLFCGGTTGHEALCLLERAGHKIFSNLHKKGERKITGADRPRGNMVLDLGDDEFTAGRPHPMIEPALRNERLLAEFDDSSAPAAMLLLFDLILGYGSHPDPAGVLAEGLAQAKIKAAPGNYVAIASITGTDLDPQDYARQRQTLESAGVIVAPDNRHASALAAEILRGLC